MSEQKASMCVIVDDGDNIIEEVDEIEFDTIELFEGETIIKMTEVSRRTYSEGGAQ